MGICDSTKKDRFEAESDSGSEDSEDESDSESELGAARPPGEKTKKLSSQKPSTATSNKPRGLLSERKPVKHFCKFCGQSFLSKFVRDKHEQVKHLQKSFQEKAVVKKTPP